LKAIYLCKNKRKKALISWKTLFASFRSTKVSVPHFQPFLSFDFSFTASLTSPQGKREKSKLNKNVYGYRRYDEQCSYKEGSSHKSCDYGYGRYVTFRDSLLPKVKILIWFFLAPFLAIASKKERKYNLNSYWCLFCRRVVELLLMCSAFMNIVTITMVSAEIPLERPDITFWSTMASIKL